jgi:hypothetical protein
MDLAYSWPYGAFFKCLAGKEHDWQHIPSKGYFRCRNCTAAMGNGTGVSVKLQGQKVTRDPPD